VCPNKSLYASAQAAFNCGGCLIEASFASQVRVKPRYIRLRSGVSCKASLLIAALFMRRVYSSVTDNSNVSLVIVTVLYRNYSVAIAAARLSM
jgi:hypothetical protein